MSERLTAALGRRFFARSSDEVAHDLIGSWLVVHDGATAKRALVVETEAYGGMDDPASHAYRGPTKRSEIMFGPPGYLYVYLIYGMYWCMNIVTGARGDASAVLLRGAELYVPTVDGKGFELTALRGPGILTRGLGITGDDNGVDCCGGEGRSLTFHRPRTRSTPIVVGRSKRIGLTKEVDRPSRYFLDGSRAVSKIPAERSRRTTS
ncbi:MAG: DNA-3-methyladenine glycosylase [Acidimicrobiales bacterium]